VKGPRFLDLGTFIALTIPGLPNFRRAFIDLRITDFEVLWFDGLALYCFPLKVVLSGTATVTP